MASLMMRSNAHMFTHKSAQLRLMVCNRNKIVPGSRCIGRECAEHKPPWFDMQHASLQCHTATRSNLERKYIL